MRVLLAYLPFCYIARMLHLYRRHLGSCGKRTRRASCSCPIWVQGRLHGKRMRKSIGIRNWESAQKIVRDWEARIDGGSMSVQDAFEKFLADCEARHLGEASIGKYRLLAAEMGERFAHRPIDAVSVDDLSHYRQSWKLAGISSQKKVERLRTFFRFCIERGWAEKNPAAALKAGRIKSKPTLPVSDEDFGKLLEATARFSKKGIYGENTGRRIKAFLLVLRYSGLRIRDCVMLKKSAVRDGRVFLYSAKTGVPVHVPLPDFVIDELNEAGNGGEYFFWSGIGKPKSAVADWQRSLARLGALAAVKFHPHQLRDSFAIGLLKHGVPIEDVAALLGNSVKVAQAHYAPWVKVRQDRLEEAVRRTFVSE